MKSTGILFVFMIQIFVCHSANVSPRGFFFQAVAPHQKVRIGDYVHLFCRVTDGGSITENADWKYCIWVRERDDSSCKTTYICEGTFCFMGIGHYRVKTRCDEPLKKTKFFGDNPEEKNGLCGLSIEGVSSDDVGKWTCMVTQCAVNGCDSDSGATISASVDISLK